MGLAVAATLWLAVADELVLYIHPRYIVFTVIMASLAVVFVIASAFMRARESHASEDASDYA
ncbi:MAG: TIGR03943 family protein, partial [Salinibacterium sp.]|nr:TIGR03943 family protein [Salinibacterium sp.]